jgi:hypothetical protein
MPRRILPTKQAAGGNLEPDVDCRRFLQGAAVIFFVVNVIHSYSGARRRETTLGCVDAGVGDNLATAGA